LVLALSNPSKRLDGVSNATQKYQKSIQKSALDFRARYFFDFFDFFDFIDFLTFLEFSKKYMH